MNMIVPYRIVIPLTFLIMLISGGCTERYSTRDIPRYMEDLKSGNSFQRVQAARALFTLGPKAKEAIPALVGALGDGSESVRNYAANALVRIGPDATGELILALKSSSYLRRGFAAWTLGRIGPEGDTVQALTIALDDEVIYVRERVIGALAEIGPAADTALPKLKYMAEHDPSIDVQSAARDAISRIRGK